MNNCCKRFFLLPVWLLSSFLAVLVCIALPLHPIDSKSVAQRSVREQLIGSWRLVSRVTHKANGEVLDDPNLAATPMGLLIYDKSGHVAAQLSRRGRNVEMLGDECKSAMATQSTPNTAQTILGYDAYFGTFSVDEKAGLVTHHLDSALFPGDIGHDIKRNFNLSGDHLNLSFDTTTQDGTPITRSLMWERMR